MRTLTNSVTNAPKIRHIDVKRTLDGPAKNPRTSGFLGSAESQYERARMKIEAIRPIVYLDKITAEDVEQVAKRCGKAPRTIRRWVSQYKILGGPEGLLTPKSFGGRGKSRIDKNAESIFRELFESRYLSEQKLGVSAFYAEYRSECYRHGVKKIPSYWAIYRRIKAQDDKSLTFRRHGLEEFKQKYQISSGTYEDGKFPLQTIMIDHTKLDIILRDETTNVEIGRPFLTIAIDAFSRCIWGYSLGFQAPNADLVGMTIVTGCQRKDNIVDNFKLSEWPVYGLPYQIHTDNGLDFRSQSLERGCTKNEINLVRRPVKRPEYGSYVERFFGTLEKKLIHTLPGTTFSNIKQKGKYDSQKRSLLNIKELERLLLEFIANQYHHEVHRTLGIAPLEKWKEGLEDRNILPQEPKDPEKFRLDFLCFVGPDGKRAIERDGVHFKDLVYYASELEILARYDKKKLKKRYFVRYDPADITKVYIYDDERDNYYKLLLKTRPQSPISLIELESSRRELKRKGARDPNEDLIMETILRRRQFVESITERSKKAIRQAAAIKRTDDVKRRNNPPSKVPEIKTPYEKVDFYPEAIDVDSAKIIRLDRKGI